MSSKIEDKQRDEAVKEYGERITNQLHWRSVFEIEKGFKNGYDYRQAEIDELKATQEKLVKALTSVITAFKQTSNLTETQKYQFLSDIEPVLAATKGEKK